MRIKNKLKIRFEFNKKMTCIFERTRQRKSNPASVSDSMVKNDVIQSKCSNDNDNSQLTRSKFNYKLK